MHMWGTTNRPDRRQLRGARTRLQQQEMHHACLMYGLHLTGLAFDCYWPHFRETCPDLSHVLSCHLVDANLPLAVIPFQIDSQPSAAICSKFCGQIINEEQIAYIHVPPLKRVLVQWIEVQSRL